MSEQKGQLMFQPTLEKGPARVLFYSLRETVKQLTKADLRGRPERKAKLEFHHSKRSQDEICRAAIARLGPRKAAQAGRLMAALLEAYIAEHGPYEKAGKWVTGKQHRAETARQAAERSRG